MTGARARSTDPETSHVAAARIGDLGITQQAVLVVLRTASEPLLDEELVALYAKKQKSLQLVEQSESGIRSRRSELAAMTPPKVLRCEKKRMKTGGMGNTWIAAPRPLDF